MKNQILCALTAVAFLSGCAELRKNAGATAENDRDVLTGGPVTGTKLKDLPPAVRETLRKHAATGEVADIDKQSKDGRTVYKVSFIEPGTNATMYIAEDGSVVKGFSNRDTNTSNPDTPK